ncbi:MAG: hypothetical protein JWR30_2397, partial [Conexibacter sp.]|nr:hypothetical protein [Conexibacter sp.]
MLFAQALAAVGIAVGAVPRAAGAARAVALGVAAA